MSKYNRGQASVALFAQLWHNRGQYREKAEICWTFLLDRATYEDKSNSSIAAQVHPRFGPIVRDYLGFIDPSFAAGKSSHYILRSHRKSDRANRGPDSSVAAVATTD